MSRHVLAVSRAIWLSTQRDTPPEHARNEARGKGQGDKRRVVVCSARSCADQATMMLCNMFQDGAPARVYEVVRARLMLAQESTLPRQASPDLGGRPMRVETQHGCGDGLHGCSYKNNDNNYNNNNTSFLRSFSSRPRIIARFPADSSERPAVLHRNRVSSDGITHGVQRRILPQQVTYDPKEEHKSSNDDSITSHDCFSCCYTGRR